MATQDPFLRSRMQNGSVYTRMRDQHLCSWELESGKEIQLLLKNTYEYIEPRVTLILKLSIPCIPDHCFRLVKQPNAQYKIHVNSRGITPTCIGKNIQTLVYIISRLKSYQ
jgi:hypothetical protein